VKLFSSLGASSGRTSNLPESKFTSSWGMSICHGEISTPVKKVAAS
jgi:hypothetical protein